MAAITDFITESLIKLTVRTADSFKNKAGPCVPMCILSTLSAPNGIKND